MEAKKEKEFNRMRELIDLLNQAGRAYYQESREIMSNYEYDALYDELRNLEETTGTVMADSPTVHVGYEVISQLPKENHEAPMLSLDKTKEIAGLQSFLGDHEGVLSWKLDGLTVVLTYRNGQLQKAVTRGNGLVGEVITNNAKVFKNVPLSIPYRGELILRGEAVIRYDDFEKINDTIEDVDSKYKNPRNLCSGSVRQLNNEITAKRNVRFYAFSLVRAVEDGAEYDFENTLWNQFDFLTKQGFDVVEHVLVNADTIGEEVSRFAAKIEHFEIPSDGLVLIYNNLAYGKSLGSTAKFPRNGIAFKWADEIAVTKLLAVDWSPSRTGLINPVAVFEPVELEGTTVSRASVHNISIVKELELGIGDELEVYKANMIIPQIARNLTKSHTLKIPEVCPVCGGPAQIRKVSDAAALYCVNPDCPAKHIKGFTLFVSRDAMNIEGLSEETLIKFIDHGFIREYADIFKLERYREEIINLPNYGVKAFDKLQKAIEKARTTALPALVYALGITGIGAANAKAICKAMGNDPERVFKASYEELIEIDGIGEVLAKSFTEYFSQKKHLEELQRLMEELSFTQPKEEISASQIMGKTFVITGTVNHFANRNELKAYIEVRGGKVTGSVTKNTDYLINNDRTSGSSKNKKAAELHIPILSEEEFISMSEEE